MGFWLFDSCCWCFSLLIAVVCMCFACAWCLVFWWFLAGCFGLLSVCIAIGCLVFCVLVVAFLGEPVACCFGLRLLVTMVLVVCAYDLFAMFTPGKCWVIDDDV